MMADFLQMRFALVLKMLTELSAAQGAFIDKGAESKKSEKTKQTDVLQEVA